MTAEAFLDDEDFRLITAEAFDFMFKNELKRAVRSQNYVTLLSIRPKPQAAGGQQQQVTREVARLVSRQVRETDLLSHDRDDRLSVILLDADHQSSLTVVERLISRFEQYEFAVPTSIAVGAACCPTDGTDVDHLRRAADAGQVRSGRDPDDGPSGSTDDVR
jgi:Diguanylate cyclase, GGDEF domain